MSTDLDASFASVLRAVATQHDGCCLLFAGGGLRLEGMFTYGTLWGVWVKQRWLPERYFSVETAIEFLRKRERKTKRPEQRAALAALIMMLENEGTI